VAEWLYVRRDQQPDGLKTSDDFAIVVLAERGPVLDRRIVIGERLHVRPLQEREHVPPNHLLDRLRV
jgi:hypothetical protein